MDDRKIIRCHARGLLRGDMEETALRACEENARGMIRAGKMMTAALYYYGRQLFLYYEAIGEEVAPEAFMGPLHPLLTPWPQKEETRDWARMYHIYWHCEPRNADDWRRAPLPERK